LPYARPAIYLPLQHYFWYAGEKFWITWIHLTWETELCGVKPLPLDLCKAVHIPKRQKVARRMALEYGLRVIGRLPYSPLQKWARDFLKIEDDRKRFQLSEEYNLGLCELLGWDYDEVKKEACERIREFEIWRLGNTCRICKNFEWSIEECKCKLIGKQVDLDDTCKSWEFDWDNFIKTNLVPLSLFG